MYSFKCLNLHPVPTYATPILITEALRRVTYIQLFQMTAKVKVTTYIALAYS